MPSAPFPADETDRLAALHETRLLGTGIEARFDQIVHLARRLTAAPIAVISLVDERRIVFKSQVGAPKAGIDLGEPQRDYWFCSYVVGAGEALVVEDTLADPRFSGHPLALGVPAIRAYAGVPLRARGGQFIGTLAIIDTTPRTVSEVELGALRELGRLAEGELASLQSAMSDSLTGVANKRMFERIGSKLLEFTDSRHEPSCVLVADFVGIGMVNELYGIDVGDLALKDAANLLRETVRASDLVARAGPDEFAVLLIAAAANSVSMVVDRIVARLRTHNELAGRPYVVSFDFGYAQHLPGDQSPIPELIAAAQRQTHDLRRRPGRS
jgi:diguanylate cyclase (GGDEF)-like protein